MRVASMHGALWGYDRWYRLSWYLGPSSLALSMIGWICLGNPVGKISVSWAMPARQAATNSQSQRDLAASASTRCFAGDDTRSVQACSWLINNGQIAGRQLASILVQRGVLQSRTLSGMPASTKNETALKDFDDALKVLPDNTDALINRAWVRMSRSEYDAALEDLNAAIGLLSPISSATARYYRGYAYLKLANYPSALADLNEAQKYQPDNAEIYLARGEVKQAQENYEAALQDFDEFIKRSPKDTRGLIWRSFVLEATGRGQEALAALESALALEPAGETLRGERDRLRAKQAEGTSSK
jgi:tetratricopeptide (TPR) repeat protein